MDYLDSWNTLTALAIISGSIQISKECTSQLCDPVDSGIFLRSIGMQKGQIFLGSTIFLSISVAIYIILGLRKNLRVSVIYLTLVAVNLIIGSFTALFSPLWNLVSSGSLDKEALSVYNLMSLIEYLTNLVVPVTRLFHVFRKS